jgi:hypothetical protein
MIENTEGIPGKSRGSFSQTLAVSYYAFMIDVNATIGSQMIATYLILKSLHSWPSFV